MLHVTKACLRMDKSWYIGIFVRLDLQHINFRHKKGSFKIRRVAVMQVRIFKVEISIN